MEVLRDPEEKILCPYNSSHHIRRCKMNTHLVKCKKSYPDAKLIECDFNVNHKIPEPELQYHHENCPDRKKLEITVYQEEGASINQYPILNQRVVTEESWDDLDVPSYDPKKYCEENEVLRHLDVESAAKRKNFRIAERHRINQITNYKPQGPSTSHAQTPPPKDRNGVVSKRVLPEKPKTTVFEDTPDSIAQLMERIKIGANKSFVPVGTSSKSGVSSSSSSKSGGSSSSSQQNKNARF